MPTLAGKAMVKIYADSKQLRRGLRGAQRRLRAFAASVRGAGMRMMGIGAAIAAPFALATKEFAKAGDEIDKMSARTGVGAETLSELVFAAEQSGASAEDLEKAIRGMQRQLFNAKRGAAEATDALGALGMSYDDLRGRSPEQQLNTILQNLEGVSDSSLRAGIAMKLLGRTGTSVLPMLGNVSSLRAEARRLNITMTELEADAAADLVDAFNVLRHSVVGVARAIGSSLSVDLSDLMRRVAEIIVSIGKWAKENRGWALTILKGTAVVMGLGAALIGLSLIISTAATLFGALSAIVGAAVTLFSALASPVGIAAVALGGLGYAFLTATDAGQEMQRKLGEGFKQLANNAIISFDAIKAALAAGDFSAAAKVMWAALKVEWVKGIQGLKEAWVGVKAWREQVAIDMGALIAKLGNLDDERAMRDIEQGREALQQRVEQVAVEEFDKVGEGTKRAIMAWMTAVIEARWARARAQQEAKDAYTWDGAGGPGGAAEATRQWGLERMTGISRANISELGNLGGGMSEQVRLMKQQLDLTREEVEWVREIANNGGLAP